LQRLFPIIMPIGVINCISSIWSFIANLRQLEKLQLVGETSN
jgi:hypothetical protein